MGMVVGVSLYLTKRDTFVDGLPERRVSFSHELSFYSWLLKTKLRDPDKCEPPPQRISSRTYTHLEVFAVP
jgi:hypothetical protein